MLHTVQEAVDWIEKWDKFSIKLGLERMERLMEALDHPERHSRVIHIAGTNGKGSTATYISSMLREAGYTIGMFTSPALTRFNDRISVNGAVISDEDLLKTVNLVYEAVESLEGTECGAPTEFEVMTTIALVYFARFAACDFVIMEVGLGGRHDSTNVVLPIIGAITNIGTDHVMQLGPTIKDIAREKAGIMKSSMPTVTGAYGEALTVIEETAKEKHAKLYRLGREFRIENIEPLADGEQFTFISPFKTYEALQISMFGSHQVHNAAVALMVVEYLHYYFALDLSEEDIRKGLKKAKWPGRFEILSHDPLVILDGAHNLEAMQALVETVQKHFPKRHVKVLFAAVKDKDHRALLNTLSELTQDITLTSFENPRAISADALKTYLPNARLEADWRKAYEALRNNLAENELLLVTGSLYFVSEIKRLD